MGVRPVVGALLVLACSPRPNGGVDPAVDCAPSTQSTSLPGSPDPHGLAGHWRVAAIAQGPLHPGKRTTGELWLWRSLASDSSRRTGVRAVARDTLTRPLYGATTLRLWDVTAVPSPGEVAVRDTVDPVYPPVLVTVHRGILSEGTPWTNIALWVESVVNRRDGVLVLDGAGFVLFLTDVDSNRFLGAWGPAGIVVADTGYFCATRVSI